MPGAAKPARSGPGTGMAWLAVSGVPTVRLPDPIDASELSRTTILSYFVECQCQIPDLCRRDHLGHDRSWDCACEPAALRLHRSDAGRRRVVNIVPLNAKTS